MSDIKDRYVFSNSTLVENPALIKVMVLKKKFLEQIEQITINTKLEWDKVEFIGIAEMAWIVFRMKDTPDRLWKAHRSVLEELIDRRLVEIDKNITYKQQVDMRVAAVSKIPQLFVE